MNRMVPDSVVSSNIKSSPYDSKSYRIVFDTVMSSNFESSPYESKAHRIVPDSVVSSNTETSPYKSKLYHIILYQTHISGIVKYCTFSMSQDNDYTT